eukprot:1146636-Pelagomonas_calceolata.AAC.8
MIHYPQSSPKEIFRFLQKQTQAEQPNHLAEFVMQDQRHTHTSPTWEHKPPQVRNVKYKLVENVSPATDQPEINDFGCSLTDDNVFWNPGFAPSLLHAGPHNAAQPLFFTQNSASVLGCQACSPTPYPRAQGRLLSSARFARLRRIDVKSRPLDITC